MIKILSKVFPRVKKCSCMICTGNYQQLGSQALDPFRPLEPGEDGCGKPNPCSLVLDVERDGWRFIRVN